MDPVNCAKKGDAEYFKRVPVDVLHNARGKDGESLLILAALNNHLDCCEAIIERCPPLLYLRPNVHGYSVLHHCSEKGNLEAVKFLITADTKIDFGDMESGEQKCNMKLLKMVNHNGDTALHIAVKQKRVEVIKLLIEADRDCELLQMVDNEGERILHYAVRTGNFWAAKVMIETLQTAAGRHCKEVLRMVDANTDTVLHLAVRQGNSEIVRLLTEADPDPDFEYCANKSGKTPFMIAMDMPDSGSILKFLIEKHQSYCKIRRQDDGWTVLHHVTRYGDLDVIKDIIRLCPDSSGVVNCLGQTFLHIAVKFERINVVKYVLETTEIDKAVLNMQDKEGNTALHIAVGHDKEKAVDTVSVIRKNIALCLLYDPRVSKKIENEAKEKAVDMINFTYNEAKAGVYSLGHQRDLKDQSSFDLLVATLIATVSFTAGITVPGGFASEGTNKGSAILLKETSFKVFVISNNFALVLSLYNVFMSFSARRLLNKEDIYYESSSASFRTRLLLKKDDIIYQLNVATVCTLGSLYAMVIAFITGSYAVLAHSDGLAITVCVTSCSLLVLASRAMWKMAMQYWLSREKMEGHD